MPKIRGGYYIKARKIQGSDIQRKPPYIREIWDWLLMNANHSKKSYNGVSVARGQLFRTYLDIREGLAWYVGYRKVMYSDDQVKKAMKVLRDAGMIETSRIAGGVLITVINYSTYQDPKNYEVGVSKPHQNENHESTNESTTRGTSESTDESTDESTRHIEKNTCKNKYLYAEKKHESTDESTDESTNESTTRAPTKALAIYNKNDKECKNDKKKKKHTPGDVQIETPEYHAPKDGGGFKDFMAFFNKLVGSKYRPLEAYRAKFKARIKEGFSLDDMKVAVANAKRDPYLMGNNNGGKRYLTPEYILRSDKLDHWTNHKPVKQKLKPVSDKGLKLLETMKEMDKKGMFA